MDCACSLLARPLVPRYQQQLRCCGRGSGIGVVHRNLQMVAFAELHYI